MLQDEHFNQSAVGFVDFVNALEVCLIILTLCYFQIQSPFLEQYLKQGTGGVPAESLQMMDLLWKYYEKQRNFLAAARILASLAEKPG